ncbi:MAG: hypothetical protein C0606_00400 [Hyphomicrobiales bacterium]|nr:MAG: hypothetical protein C0606_00400 [Hyphomicrobiales bacterium]
MSGRETHKADAAEAARLRIRVGRFLACGAARCDAGDTRDLKVLVPEEGISRRSLRVAAAAIKRMQADGIVAVSRIAEAGPHDKAPTGSEIVSLTREGRAWLRRTLSAGDDAFRRQHGSIAERRIELGDGTADTCLVDDAESPLAWLYRRRSRDGRKLLDDAQFNAGERLRHDFTRGQLMPRITANWNADINQGRRRSGEAGGSSDLTDAALAARVHVEKALDAVGPELSGVLIDVCCFLKGLAEVEKERQWPARSAKVILVLGLTRLARHYGYGGDFANRKGSVRHWGATDYRPTL